MNNEKNNGDEKANEGLEEFWYGVHPELIKSLNDALEKGDNEEVERLIAPLHAADVADLIEHLNLEKRRQLVEIIRSHFDAEILNSLDDSVREDIIEQLGPQDLAAAVADMDSDDALSVLEDLDQYQQREVLRAIPAEDRAILEEVLSYPEKSAGRLMQWEVARVPSFWTVGDALKFLRESLELPETFYEIFVVDPRHRPIGSVELNRLLRHDPSTKIETIMGADIRRIPVNMDQEEVAFLFRHYALVSAPVVDAAGRIIGMITVDDVVNVIEEEATEDIMNLAKVGEADFHAPVSSTVYMRFRWLTITLLNTLCAATVISQFQDTLQQLISLAVLMSIITAMGGNSGMQVVTSIVRAIATRDLRPSNTVKTVLKELAVGSINGFLFALFLGAGVAYWYQNLGLGFVLGGAMLFNMIWAAFAGTMLPIFVSRIGMDPALSAGPLLTTTTDVLGFSAFLGLASFFLL